LSADDRRTFENQGGRAMKMHIEAQSHAAALKDQLERDGWHVDQRQDGSMLATSRDVIYEPEARRRLDHMGLLTSSRVRIEFVVAREPGQ
jgi:hypothetical protein